MTIEDDLVQAQRRALKSGDKATVNVIRQVQAEVAVARTAEGFRGEVDDELYLATIEAYVKRMAKARTEFEAAGERGREQADKLSFEIDYLSAYLPDKLGEEETRALVVATIAELGAEEPGDRGKVIGAVMRSGEELDGSLVARLVAEELG
jgi:uncharacterized protein YqeY